MDETRAITVRLPADLYEELRLAAFEQRVRMNHLVQEGIKLRLARIQPRRPAGAESPCGAVDNDWHCHQTGPHKIHLVRGNTGGTILHAWEDLGNEEDEG